MIQRYQFDGDWVKYEDHKKATDELLKALIEEYKIANSPPISPSLIKRLLCVIEKATGMSIDQALEAHNEK